MENDQKNQTHFKAKKSVDKKKSIHNGKNLKAFSVNAPKKLERMSKRSHDLKEKRLHLPQIDRTPDEIPPMIVGVMGPPGTGKTTLIRSLIRRFSKVTLNEIKGPITVVSGKHRRLTIIEINGDLSSMIDIAKIVDLVLLVIDGNFGFEMQTMEFLNILQQHGMPKVLGITTHLDLFKSPSTLKAAKKRLKHRFWTEVYQGAKLFYFSGVINGKYPDREVLNLGRFISVIKLRPLSWRNEHPYVLVDKMKDLTMPQVILDNPKIDRNVIFYGYSHGSTLSYENQKIHIPGVGDFKIDSVEIMPDPCPTPYYEERLEKLEREKQKQRNIDNNELMPKTPRLRKRLDDKKKIIYAPYSDVGGMVIDNDNVYIDFKSKESFVSGENLGLGEKLITNLQNKNDFSLKFRDKADFKVFTSSTLKENQLNDETNSFYNDYGRKSLRTSDTKVFFNNVENQNKDFDNSKSDDEPSENILKSDLDEISESGDSENENEDVKKKSSYNLLNPKKKKFNLNELIYSTNHEPFEIENILNSDYHDLKFSNSELIGNEDCFITLYPSISNLKYLYDSDDSTSEDKKLSNIQFKSKFFIDPIEIVRDIQTSTDQKDDLDYFEDLENENFDKEPLNSDENSENISLKRKLISEKKATLKTTFEKDEFNNLKFNDFEKNSEIDTWYELQKKKFSERLLANKIILDELDEITKKKIMGFMPGSYLRILIKNVPCEFINNFKPSNHIILCGLTTNESKFGIMNVRLRKHRWFKRLLKSNNPLIVSMGWRKYQTIPIYTTSDSRTRNRMLKYTPEHTYCTASFYGPLVPPNTSFICFNFIDENSTTGSFRISAIGVVENISSTVEIVKKLKLVGHPYKIFKNTAFIKNMFTSALEVANFEGASIKTVSGLRGEIKKALSTPEGCFRATFEDKILMSDIVFLKTWYPIEIKRFYNPVCSLLLEDHTNWKGMKLVSELRCINDISLEQNPNSQYEKIERVKKKFAPVIVPQSIKNSLPYKSQIRQMKPQKKKSYLVKRAVVMNKEEIKSKNLLQTIVTIHRDKEKKKQEKKREILNKKIKLKKKDDEFKIEKKRKEKADFFKKELKKKKSFS